jgi:hypothetical protein
MSKINVKSIVAEYLKENGYYGLCKDTCGCVIDDLMPCGNDWNGTNCHDCQPGYRVTCNCEGECDFHLHITTEKPENKEAVK